MGKNIKINNAEPCLCGSGKKFKECCKLKMFVPQVTYDDDVLSNPQRINAILEKRMKDTDFKVCMYPVKTDCKLPIKNAHTLQNNGVLSIIAENNHVMVLDVLNLTRSGTAIKKISKNKATTFYGFCEFHDSFLFKDIELREYLNEEKQNFLHAYRIASQEYHKKQRVLVALQNCIKDNPSILQSQDVVELYRMDELSLADVRGCMDIFNEAHLSQRFNILHTYSYEFNFQCQFAVATMFVPAARINGEKLIDIYSKDKKRLPSVFMTVIPGNNKSHFIMSCFKIDYPIIKSYFNDVEKLDEEELKRFLNWTLPTYSENIVLSPRIWEAWNAAERRDFEMKVSGQFGDFGRVLRQEDPFANVEELFNAFQTQWGIINMKKDPKYDLFRM